MSEFKKYVDGKSVVIVGPAGYMAGLTQGSLIDSFDIVIRLNSALPIPEVMKVNIGVKTNVLSNCLEPNANSGGSINPPLWKEHGVEWVISPYPRSLSYIKGNFSKFLKKNNNLLKYTDTPINLFSSIENKVKTRPNTGILTIMYLLSFNISNLYVTGFSFARDGYYPGYKTQISVDKYKQLANSNIHKQAPQLDYLRAVIDSDSRIVIDEKMREIMNEK